jgi:hypothetical protein
MREARYLRRLARLYGADKKPAEQLDRETPGAGGAGVNVPR